jgi:hypothetical protein
MTQTETRDIPLPTNEDVRSYLNIQATHPKYTDSGHAQFVGHGTAPIHVQAYKTLSSRVELRPDEPIIQTGESGEPSLNSHLVEDMEAIKHHTRKQIELVSRAISHPDSTRIFLSDLHENHNDPDSYPDPMQLNPKGNQQLNLGELKYFVRGVKEEAAIDDTNGLEVQGWDVVSGMMDHWGKLEEDMQGEPVDDTEILLIPERPWESEDEDALPTIESHLRDFQQEFEKISSEKLLELSEAVLKAAGIQLPPDSAKRAESSAESERRPQVNVHINRLDVAGEWITNGPEPGAIAGLMSDIKVVEPDDISGSQTDSAPTFEVNFAEAETFYHQPIRDEIDPNASNPAGIHEVMFQGQSLHFAGIYMLNKKEALVRLHMHEDDKSAKVVVEKIALELVEYMGAHGRKHNQLKPNQAIMVILHLGPEGEIHPQSMFLKPSESDGDERAS